MSNVEVRLRALLWRLCSVAEGGDDPQIVRLDGFADVDAMRDQLVGTCRTSLRSLHSQLPHGDQTASAQRTAELVTRGIRMQTVRLRNRLLGPEGRVDARVPACGGRPG